MAELILKEESYQIIGACFEVYNTMGSGFLESVYQECLEIELRDRGIPFNSKQKLRLQYKQRQLEKSYEADLICFEKIILELKAVSKLTSDHEAQAINYLHATRLPLGILINFGHHPKLEYKRIAFTQKRNKID